MYKQISSRSKKKGKSVLITGGAGFLGSNLCERLTREGFAVTCLDNLTTGSIGNIQHLLGKTSFRFMQHDVCKPFNVEASWIFNLACPASPPAYQSDPVQTTMTSVLGACNVLELAAKTGARVVQASTSEVYGDPLEHPQIETYWGNVNPIGPRACYDVGKRCAETLFFDYHRQNRADIRVARIFNTYGERMRPDDGRVVSNFVVEALQNQDITVYGDGLQTRSLCYVDDLIEGLMCLMFGDTMDPGPYNLGNPDEHTILEFAEIVIALTGSSSKIVHFERPIDDPHIRCPNIDRIRNTFDWRPRVGLEDGLRRTIAYFESRIAGSNVAITLGA